MLEEFLCAEQKKFFYLSLPPLKLYLDLFYDNSHYKTKKKDLMQSELTCNIMLRSDSTDNLLSVTICE